MLGRLVRYRTTLLGMTLVGLLAVEFGGGLAAHGQDPKSIVEQAVRTELDANRNDHSRFLYFDVDHKPNSKVTRSGWRRLRRATCIGCWRRTGGSFLRRNRCTVYGGFYREPRPEGAATESRQAGFDDQATKLLKLLPEGFTWSVAGSRDGNTLLRFKPNPEVSSSGPGVARLCRDGGRKWR